jgi:hypothetical protein
MNNFTSRFSLREYNNVAKMQNIEGHKFLQWIRPTAQPLEGTSLSGDAAIHTLTHTQMKFVADYSDSVVDSKHRNEASLRQR